MKYEYARLDLIKVIHLGMDIQWLYTAPNCEYREDYVCFFILRSSTTYTMAVLKYGDIFD